jgi:hypothetical protein
MRGYSQFVASLSKFKLTKPEDVISRDNVAFKLSPVGFIVNRCLTIANFIPQLIKEIQEYIPYTPSGGQPIIYSNYLKIMSIWPVLSQFTEQIENNLPSESRCLKHISDAQNYCVNLQKTMETLGGSTASQMAQILDQVQNSVSYVDQLASAVVVNLSKYESKMAASSPSLDPSKVELFHSLAATLVAFDQLAINLLFLSTLDAVKAQAESFQKWSTQLFHLCSTTFEHAQDTPTLTAEISSAVSNFVPRLYQFIAAFQQTLNNTQDLTNVTKALIAFAQSLNLFVIKLKQKELLDVIRNFSVAFVQGKPLDELLVQSQALIQFFAGFGFGQNVDTVNSITVMTQICASNPETTAFVIASICRYCAYVFPGLIDAEEALNTLALKITDIIKNIFQEARQVLNDLIAIIDANLEFFNDEFLGEVNYVLQGSKTIIDFIPSDPNFVSQQQLFFDALGSITTPLSKLVSTCADADTKAHMTQLNEKLRILGSRYAQWLVQFYLTNSSIITLRADTIQSLLSFPLGVLCGMGMQQYLNTTLEAIKGIQGVLQTSPQLSSLEIEGITKLIQIINNFGPPGTQFIEIANRNKECASFPLFKIATTALAKANSKLPNLAASISSICLFSNNESFVCSVAAYVTHALAIGQSVQQLVERCDQTALFFLSVPCTIALICDTLVQKAQPFAESLLPSIGSLKSTIDVIWPLVSSIAKGEDNKDKANLPTFASRFISSLSELLTAIGKLPQPILPYKIPDDIQEIKRFDAMADSIHSTLVKSFAKHIVRTMKKGKSSDARSVLMQWFEATQVQTIEVSDGLARLNENIMQLITSSTTDRSQFIESFASLSVSLAATENSYGKTVSPFIQALHKELVELILELLENTRGTAQGQLMKIISCITKISALAPISKLKQKEIERYSASIISNVVHALNVLRMKGKDVTLNDSINACKTLSEFAALSLVAPQDLDATQLLESVTQSKADQQLGQYISKFAEKLSQLEPSMFNQLATIRDSDTVCDYVYDKAELFRDEVNKLLALAKTPNPSMIDQVNESLQKMLVSSADAAILTMHSLMLGGLAFTLLSRTLVECFSELTASFVDFVELAQKIPESKSDLSGEIRRINRKMSKQFDTLINIVENPQRPTGEISEFEASKNQMYADLSTVSIQIARLMALAAAALVPEMWTTTRAEIIDTLAAALQQLSSSVSAVRGKAVGASSTQLGAQFTELENGLPALTKASEMLDFGASFTPAQILAPIKAFSTTLLVITKASPSLTDRIIIEPDPTAAARVPDSYELPPLPEQALSPTDALDEMELAKRQLDASIVEFKKVTDGNLTPSGELLSALASLTKSSNSFAEKALGMARATVEARSQVEQQATLHGFSNAITAVQNAMKSRLLRTPNFEHEMEDALTALRNASDASMRIAVDASKIDIQQPGDESMDEVTRELTATSKAIEEMTSRLSQFAQQVDIEAIAPVQEESQTPTINADAGSLPAFLIASAQPIFQATAKILVRAREITAALIEKFGKIDNEAGMVKVAQDLTEAAELLIICAEILVNGGEDDAEFKVIAAAKIIKAAVASLVAQVLVKGGDAEGIMNAQVKVVSRHTDAIIKMAEKIVEEKLNEADAKAPKKAVKNPMILKLNMQQTVNQQRKQLQEEEKNLYAFRRRGNK